MILIDEERFWVMIDDLRKQNDSSPDIKNPLHRLDVERAFRESTVKPQGLEEIKKKLCKKCGYCSHSVNKELKRYCSFIKITAQAYVTGTATAPEQYKKLASDLAIENQALKATIDQMKGEASE